MAEIHSLGPWTDGVIYALPPEQLPRTAAAASQNVEISIGGEALTRPGFVLYNAAVGGGTVTATACGLAVFSASSEAEFLIAGTSFYENVSGTWTARAGATITAADDNTWTWVMTSGGLFATSNSKADAPIKWAAAGGATAAAGVSSRFTQAAHCEWWDSSLWYGNENNFSYRLWYSDVLTPETIGATSFLNFSEAITGLKGLRSTLAVHTENSISLVFYDTGTSAYIQQQRADKGTVSGRSIVVNTEGQMFFVREDGIYQWDIDSPVATETSGTPKKISLALDGARYWNNINKSRLHQSFAVDYPAKSCVWFVLPYGASQTDMNHIMIYNYAETKWYGPYLNFTRNCGALIDSVPHLGGYDDGSLYTHESGTSDAGTAIDAWIDTSAGPAIAPGATVRWLWASTSFNVTGEYDIYVRQTADRAAARTEYFNAGGSYDAIGAFKIGTSAIAGHNLMRAADTDLQGYSDSLQLRYGNGNLDQCFSLRLAQCFYRPIGILRQQRSGVH